MGYPVASTSRTQKLDRCPLEHRIEALLSLSNMANERISQLQAEINAKLEVLKATNDPAKRRELMLALKKLFAEIGRFQVGISHFLQTIAGPARAAIRHRSNE
jgi:hypothetical protein